MASAVEDHFFPALDLDLAIDLPGAGEILGLEPNDVSLSDNPAGETAREDDDVPTPNSGSISASRTPGSETTRRREAVIRKSRRVRTGCLTCRERHLKCDEALHRCQNCRKSGRVCRRGVRLNFIDTQVVAPPNDLTPSPGHRVTFRDESRHIASEYVGGFERYPPPAVESSLDGEGAVSPPSSSRYNTVGGSGRSGGQADGASFSPNAGSVSTPQLVPDRSASFAPFKSKQGRGPSNACLSNPEEAFLVQTFVAEVGPWMDSMDELKHFTNILPFHALEEPMLLKAFMACGARHMFNVNPSYGEEKATYFHDLASRDLLSMLQDPDRDSVLCATAGVILNIYELMCSRSTLSVHGMNHVAGARALIKECRWDATSQGLGSACFWLNVSMELLSCLHFNWALAWDPDTWGVDMNMEQAQAGVAGNEELWAHRMVYICAKVANFRSSSHMHGLDHSTTQIDQWHRDWCTYNDWCDQWANAVPRSMTPFGYLQAWQTNSKSVFPEIWLIKRSSIIARLFYHTARILLTKVHPLESEFSSEMQSVQQSHAHDVCGIISHTKDRWIIPFCTRFLSIAASCLATRDAQDEILNTIDRIVKDGCQIEHIKDELQEAWGWTVHPHHDVGVGVGVGVEVDNLFNDHAFNPESDLSSSMLKMNPPVVVNPLLAFADFELENHPYQGFYVKPRG